MAIVATGLERAIERAIERATQGGARVVAEGRRKSDGARLFFVPSARDGALWHPVALIAGGERLQCDCKAGQHGRVCVHQGAVALYLRAKVRADLERMERRQVVRSVDRSTGEVSRVVSAASSWERETALPRYRTDNRPITIWR